MAARAPKLDTYAKQQAYKQWQEEQAAAMTGTGGEPDGNDAAMNENERANAGVFEPGSFGDQNARANKTAKPSGDGMIYRGPGNRNEYPAANPSQMAALKKKPGDRTLQEKNDLKIRSRAEELALKKGQRIAGAGISQDLIAEDVGQSVGKREAKAAVAYNDASDSTLADAGRGPDGSKLTTPAVSASSDATKSTSGGTLTLNGITTKIPAGGQDIRPAPGSPGFSPTGYALRKMQDGTFRGASPDGNGGTSLRNFNTQADALAYYRPPAPAPLDNTMGQRAAAGMPMFQPPGTASASIPGPFQAAYQAGMPSPAPTTLQTPEAAKTTSPTTQLQMNAPATGQTPAVAQTPAPVSPFGTFAAPNPQFATKSPDGSVSPTVAGVDYLRKRAGEVNREMGTPKRTGYQAIASELNPSGN